ncbi:MAG: hypothetical protein ACJAVK_000476 [Akkermansiaceae bacterium]|jgi:hypothetical protein
MAIEDNTVVEIDEIKAGIVFTDTPASGSILTGDKITVTLQRGESYVVGIKLDQYAAQGGTAPSTLSTGPGCAHPGPSWRLKRIPIFSSTVIFLPSIQNPSTRGITFLSQITTPKLGRSTSKLPGPSSPDHCRSEFCRPFDFNFAPPFNPDITSSVEFIAVIALIGEATANIGAVPVPPGYG